MAILTVLELERAQAIGRHYGIEVREVHPILAGSVNSNYALLHAGRGSTAAGRSGGGIVFLRIYEEQDASAASREAALLNHLSAAGVRTPRPIAREDGGGFTSEHAGKPVALFPWCDGQMICQAGVTPERAWRVGEALARVHLAGATFPGAAGSRFDVPRLRGRLESVAQRALAPPLRAVVRELSAALDRAGELLPPPSESQGVIHGDLFRDNVLWRSDGNLEALLDFESASRGSFAFDLMVTVLAWCYGGAPRAAEPPEDGGAVSGNVEPAERASANFEPALTRAMMAGYGSTRPMPEAERARLWAEACFAATRFTITRITDFELRSPRAGVFKDYQRFLARLREIEALGPGGWQTLLGVPPRS